MIKPPLRGELEAADAAGEALIVLDRGQLEDGTPYWAYVAVKPSKHREFMQLGKTRQPRRISDYGAILKYGLERGVPDADWLLLSSCLGDAGGRNHRNALRIGSCRNV